MRCGSGLLGPAKWERYKDPAKTVGASARRNFHLGGNRPLGRKDENFFIFFKDIFLLPTYSYLFTRIYIRAGLPELFKQVGVVGRWEAQLVTAIRMNVLRGSYHCFLPCALIGKCDGSEVRRYGSFPEGRRLRVG